MIPGNSLINAHSKQYKEQLQAGRSSEELQVLGSCPGGPDAFKGSPGVCLLSACPCGRQLRFPMA